MELRYLYMGSSDTESDVAGWLLLPGARLHWRFRHFGADVAAIDPGARPFVLVADHRWRRRRRHRPWRPPFVLVADHRPPVSMLPIYGTSDLDDAIAMLQGSAWGLELGPMETPEGPACVLRTASGMTVALLQVDRPDAMETAYADVSNSHRVIH